MILLSFWKVTNGGRATSHRWGWGQLFWELSCSFSIFFPSWIFYPTSQLKNFSFSHKKTTYLRIRSSSTWSFQPHFVSQNFDRCFGPTVKPRCPWCQRNDVLTWGLWSDWRFRILGGATPTPQKWWDEMEKCHCFFLISRKFRWS